MMRYTRVDSPVGSILLAGDGGGLRVISLPRDRTAGRPRPDWLEDGPALAPAARQLRAYFAGELRRFDLELAPEGTPFQRTVWRALERIPYGETISYGELAREIGRPNASRAVGAANGRNPLAIVIPCHRVIGSNGGLTGYGGGLDTKRALLELERKHAPRRGRQRPLAWQEVSAP